MSPRTDRSGRIAIRSEDAPTNGAANNTLEKFLSKMAPEMERCLPKHMTVDRMCRITLTALRTVPKLAQCSTVSFAGCVMQLAQLGLEPNTPLGHAYLVPRKNGKLSEKAGHEIVECTLVAGYKGYIELARRAGVNIKAEIVYDGDFFERELGLNPTMVHKPSSDPKRALNAMTHAYAIARGRALEEPIFEVLDRVQVELRMARSSDPRKTFWKDNAPAMWRKSAVRALVTWAPLSVEVERFGHLDEAPRALAGSVDPIVAETLSKHGLELPASDEAEDDEAAPGALTSGDERSIEYDQETGEVVEARREREPGEEG